MTASRRQISMPFVKHKLFKKKIDLNIKQNLCFKFINYNKNNYFWFDLGLLAEKKIYRCNTYIHFLTLNAFPQSNKKFTINCTKLKTHPAKVNAVGFLREHLTPLKIHVINILFHFCTRFGHQNHIWMPFI